MLLTVLLLVLLSDSVNLYIVNHGWHAGLILPITSVQEEQLPLVSDFPRARYLEIGWGDAAFYQAREPTLSLALRAIVKPTPSVLHVVGLYTTPDSFFVCQPILRLRLSTEQFYRLVAYIARSMARDAHGRPIRLQKGLYGRSFFYASAETYHLLNTCNVWVARGLREAGLSLYPWMSITVPYLWTQLRAAGAQPVRSCR